MELKYSIDMSVLTTRVRKKDIEKFMNRYADDPNFNYWQGYGIKAYKHNFNISEGDSSIFLGIHHNMKNNPQDSIDVTMKYNPNKVKGEYLKLILNEFFINNCYTKIKSFDVAIDIPLNITRIYPVPYGKIGKRVFDNGGDDKTYYFGQRSSDGAIKIYNKTREAKLDYDLTRYEITFNPDISVYMAKNLTITDSYILPCNVINDTQLPMELIGTDKVLVLACVEHEEYLKELSRRKRDKVKELISNCFGRLEIDINSINNTFNSYISSILPY